VTRVRAGESSAKRPMQLAAAGCSPCEASVAASKDGQAVLDLTIASHRLPKFRPGAGAEGTKVDVNPPSPHLRSRTSPLCVDRLQVPVRSPVTEISHLPDMGPSLTSVWGQGDDGHRRRDCRARTAGARAGGSRAAPKIKNCRDILMRDKISTHASAMSPALVPRRNAPPSPSQADRAEQERVSNREEQDRPGDEVADAARGRRMAHAGSQRRMYHLRKPTT
jgi:hypothetical protein